MSTRFAIICTVVIGIAASVQSAASANAQAVSAVRVVHLAVGASALDIAIDGQERFGDVAFKSATDYAPLTPANHTIKVTLAGQTEQALVDAPFSVQPGQQVTVALIGETPSISALVLNDDNTAPPPGQVRVRFVHGAPDVPPADMQIRGGRELFDGVAFGVAGEYIDVTSGTYVLDVRPDGKEDVALSVPNVALSAGQVVTIFATGKISDNTLTAVPIVYRASTVDQGAITVVRTGTGLDVDRTWSAERLLLVASLLIGSVATIGLYARRRSRDGERVEPRT